MPGIADMAHHHANGADTGCLGNQPSGAGRRQQHGCRTGRVIAQCQTGFCWRRRYDHCQRSQTRRRPARPGLSMFQQYAPHLAIRHCLLKTGDNAVIACHSGKWPHTTQPVHQRAGHRQYSNTVHHPVNTGQYVPPAMYSSVSASIPGASSCTCCCGTERLAAPSRARARKRKPAHRRAARSSGSLNAAAIMCERLRLTWCCPLSGLRLSAICC